MLYPVNNVRHHHCHERHPHHNPAYYQLAKANPVVVTVDGVPVDLARMVAFDCDNGFVKMLKNKFGIHENMHYYLKGQVAVFIERENA